MQMFYSVLGLDPNRGMDIIMDEKNQNIALQSDNDCKKTGFHDSLLPIHLFFTMFDTLTDYKGVENGLHRFQLLQMTEKPDSPKFSFLFDSDNNLRHTRVEHPSFGLYDFDVIKTITGRSFKDNEWDQPDCGQI